MKSWLFIASFALASVVGLGAQSPGAPPAPGAKPAQTTSPKPAAAASSVDTVISLVKKGMSEALVIRTLRSEGGTHKLSTADLLKLTNAGVSEAIITAMTEPAGVAAASAVVAPAAAGAPAAGGATAFPPDLPDLAGAASKRRLAVRPFDYSTVISWVNYWFSNDVNVGEGIRAMLTVRMAQSNTMTLLERTHIDDVMKEQDLAGSNRVRQGTGAKIGRLSGADVSLYGDIVIFGRDDTTKRKGLGAAIGMFSPIAGAAVAFKREEKAVVGINLRLVDTETGEVIQTAEARGESSRSSKDYAGLLGVQGAAVGGGSNMTSSNFQQTIIGEATSNAVTKIAEFLESRVPQLPAKPRAIEGRLATLAAGNATLAVGSNDGVLRGDRFEILQINGEIRDPVTKDVIDIDAVKIGELVVDTVRDRMATGAYGGQPLSSAYVTAAGKGYAARLMSK